MTNFILPSEKIMYRALIEKDSTYEGVFFAGIKTTGIFCRPTCTAKKPLEKNVECFHTIKEAISLGYRPCKICSPLSYKGSFPPWISPLMEEIEGRPELRFRDYELRKRGVDPARARCWFQKNYGMTFQAYLRLLRIGKAFGRIRHGEKFISAAFESGYESLSGFSEFFKKTNGFSPKQSEYNNIVYVTRILTPLGPMFAGATDAGICLLEFIDRRMLETEIKCLSKLLKATFVPGESKFFGQLNEELDEYFSGMRTEFNVPLVTPGTEIQKKAWGVLRKIPYGKTGTYGEQAKIINNPRAVRAVARANGDNRVAILIPCHRVAGADGQLTGYGGGLERKQFLLDLEKEIL